MTVIRSWRNGFAFKRKAIINHSVMNSVMHSCLQVSIISRNLWGTRSNQLKVLRTLSARNEGNEGVATRGCFFVLIFSAVVIRINYVTKWLLQARLLSSSIGLHRFSWELYLLCISWHNTVSNRREYFSWSLVDTYHQHKVSYVDWLTVHRGYICLNMWLIRGDEPRVPRDRTLIFRHEVASFLVAREVTVKKYFHFMLQMLSDSQTVILQ